MRVVELRAENGALRARIGAFERNAGRDSGNSSMPPSSDPLTSRAERRWPVREAYKRSMRKPGDQPGHEGKSRELVPLERVNKHLEYLPDCCGRGHEFAGSEERGGDSVVHPKYELPVIIPLVFQHASVRSRCPACQTATLASLTASDGPGFGPRRDAHIAVLTGAFRLARDQVRQTRVVVCGIPASKRSVYSVIMRISAALADLRPGLRRRSAADSPCAPV